MEYKGFEILGGQGNGLKAIKAVGQGSVPKSLRGFYTSQRFAEQGIDKMLAEKAQREAAEAAKAEAIKLAEEAAKALIEAKRVEREASDERYEKLKKDKKAESNGKAKK